MRKLAPKRLIGLLTIALWLIGCGSDSSSPTQSDPVVVDPVETMTETFSGSIVTGGSSEHVFTVQQTGSAEMTITALEPLATLTVGLGIGNVGDDATCILFAQDNSVRVGETLRASGLVPADYCVRISDVGNIFEGITVDYSLDVDHP